MTTAETSAQPTRRPRRLWRWLGRVLLVLVLLVAAAPYLFRIGPVRQAILGLAFADLNGTVEVGSAPLGWGSPLRLYDVKIQPQSGPPLVEIPVIEGSRALWRLFYDREAIGVVEIRDPRVNLVVQSGGMNFQHLFPPRERDEELEQRRREQLAKSRVSLDLRLVNGHLAWQGKGAEQPWDVGPFNLEAGLQGGDEQTAPELVVQPGKVFDHVTLTPAMCRDLFQYLAPALAGVTAAQGAFSLELDRWQIPLDLPQQGTLGGRWTIHRVAASPGPLVQMIGSMIRFTTTEAANELPDDQGLWLELASESTVVFEMRDGRVYHRDLRFGLGSFQIEERGSVGLDQTLDIEARIHLPDGVLARRPFLKALSEQTLVLPIKGTLQKPQIDAKRFGGSSLQAVLSALDAAVQDKSRDDEQLEEELRDSGLVGDGALLGENALIDEQGQLDPESLNSLIEAGMTGAGELLDWWRQRRAEQQAEEPPSESGDTAPSGGLFRRLRRPRPAAGALPGASADGPLEPGVETLPPPVADGAPADDAGSATETPGEEKPQPRRGRRFEGLRRRLRGAAPAEDAPAEDNAPAEPAPANDQDPEGTPLSGPMRPGSAVPLAHVAKQARRDHGALRQVAWRQHQDSNGDVAAAALAGANAGDQRTVAAIALCWCPAGRFEMGSPRSEPERRPFEQQVTVTLSRGFWIGKYEVTQGDWKRVAGKLPGEFTEELPAGDDLPVGNVNFAEAEAFCAQLTEQAQAAGELPAGWEFRLPTEAQWEYACRAGTTTATSFGPSIDSRQANFRGEKPYNGAEPGPTLGRAAKVGSYPPNPWGIHDMHGNTCEWCRDWFHNRYPGGADPDLHDALATASKNEAGDYSRSRRGSCWADPGWPSRSAFRQRFEPARRYDHIGFRVVLVRVD
ncbi:MAG: SUMF1/EgtB/PvdO family nonheme iron enzyme [Pirellulales bacterium]|nr:SUMF1/EgtB/PvdO family nonheme iron enzyme [Pirellulales bacterium]